MIEYVLAFGFLSPVVIGTLVLAWKAVFPDIKEIIIEIKKK
jgi:hypothetical protein